MLLGIEGNAPLPLNDAPIIPFKYTLHKYGDD
jgi:hypothetical protein